MIVIGGMIGLGKTSLARLLAGELGSQVFYESVSDNPVLPLFYQASVEEIELKRYPFLLQLHFLGTRFEAIKKAQGNKKNVLDRSIYEDLYFCRANMLYGRLKSQNRITDLEYQIYEKLFFSMMKELKELKPKSPDLMIYLHGDFDKTVLPRIMERGREFETDEELIEYYRFIWSGYDSWIENNYSASKIIKINMDKLDVVNRREDFEEVLETVKKFL